MRLFSFHVKHLLFLIDYSCSLTVSCLRLELAEFMVCVIVVLVLTFLAGAVAVAVATVLFSMYCSAAAFAHAESLKP